MPGRVLQPLRRCAGACMSCCMHMSSLGGRESPCGAIARRPALQPLSAAAPLAPIAAQRKLHRAAAARPTLTGAAAPAALASTLLPPACRCRRDSTMAAAISKTRKVSGMLACNSRTLA